MNVLGYIAFIAVAVTPIAVMGRVLPEDASLGIYFGLGTVMPMLAAYLVVRKNEKYCATVYYAAYGVELLFITGKFSPAVYIFIVGAILFIIENRGLYAKLKERDERE